MLSDRILHANGWRAILLVSSPYHMRRALLAWRRAAPDIEVIADAGPAQPVLRPRARRVARCRSAGCCRIRRDRAVLVARLDLTASRVIEEAVLLALPATILAGVVSAAADRSVGAVAVGRAPRHAGLLREPIRRAVNGCRPATTAGLPACRCASTILASATRATTDRKAARHVSDSRARRFGHLRPRRRSSRRPIRICSSSG